MFTNVRRMTFSVHVTYEEDKFRLLFSRFNISSRIALTLQFRWYSNTVKSLQLLDIIIK